MEFVSLTREMFISKVIFLNCRSRVASEKEMFDDLPSLDRIGVNYFIEKGSRS